MSRSRILVVDDEKYICEIIRSVLADSLGHDVVAFNDPQEAIDYVDRQRVDLVLTDLVMGRLSGIDILKHCSARQPDAVVIFMTGHPTVENAISVLKLGAYDYLIKPFKLETLRAAVERGLEKLKLYRENVHLKNLVSLYNISIAMGSSAKLDSLLKLVLESAAAEFDAELASIALIDSITGGLVKRAHIGGVDQVERHPLLMGEHELNRQVVDTGEPEIQHDYSPTESQQSATSTSLAVCAPLYVKGKVIGTLNLVREAGVHSFASGDLQSLSIIASKAASAIENSRLYDELEEAYLATIKALANAVEARDCYTRGHTERVTDIAEIMAAKLGWSNEQMRWLRIGATLHDIGKIGVPDRILNKPGKLGPDEFELMRQHPVQGAAIIQDIPFLAPIRPYVLYHHEKWDGSGYPSGLAGEDIPLEGRLLAVADTVDAILSTRPYRNAMTSEKVISELKAFRGIQFDPLLVDLFLQLIDDGEIDLEMMYHTESQVTSIDLVDVSPRPVPEVGC